MSPTLKSQTVKKACFSPLCLVAQYSDFENTQFLSKAYLPHVSYDDIGPPFSYSTSNDHTASASLGKGTVINCY